MLAISSSTRSRCFAVRTPPRSDYDRRMRLCATLYVVAAAYRSCFPVLWEARPHGCLFAWPGGALVDQIFSQVGEVAFAVQVALATERALRLRGQPASAAVARNTYLVIAFGAAAAGPVARPISRASTSSRSCWAPSPRSTARSSRRTPRATRSSAVSASSPCTLPSCWRSTCPCTCSSGATTRARRGVRAARRRARRDGALQKCGDRVRRVARGGRVADGLAACSRR